MVCLGYKIINQRSPNEIVETLSLVIAANCEHFLQLAKPILTISIYVSHTPLNLIYHFFVKKNLGKSKLKDLPKLKYVLRFNKHLCTHKKKKALMQIFINCLSIKFWQEKQNSVLEVINQLFINLINFYHISSIYLHHY